jgi:hypothetical protein
VGHGWLAALSLRLQGKQNLHSAPISSGLRGQPIDG